MEDCELPQGSREMEFSTEG